MGEELDAVCELLLTFTEFGTPTTRPVDFDAIIGGNLPFEARELLSVATQQRETLMDGICNGGRKVDPRNVIGAVETYLPSIYKITHSMETSASAQIKLNRPLEFSWTSVLYKKSRQNKENKCGVLVYEVCFILTIKALAHYNYAKLLLDPEDRNRVSNLVAAAKELRIGSGILEFVATAMLPRWVEPPANRPPEVITEVVGALAGYFLAMAQRITIVQAIVKKSPPSVIAKLLLGLSEKYGAVNYSLRKLDRTLWEALFEPLVDEPPLMTTVTHMLAARFLAENSRSKTKPGEAVAYMLMASEGLTKVNFTQAMQQLEMSEKIMDVRHVIDGLFHEYKSENESVYFDGVPTQDRLEIPPGSFLVKPVDYSLPDVNAVSFASVHVEEEAAAASSKSSPKRKSGISSWFGMGGGSKKEAEDDDVLKAPPGYDESVFNELPIDIQKEVVAAYKAEQKR